MGFAVELLGSACVSKSILLFTPMLILMLPLPLPLRGFRLVPANSKTQCSVKVVGESGCRPSARIVARPGSLATPLLGKGGRYNLFKPSIAESLPIFNRERPAVGS